MVGRELFLTLLLSGQTSDWSTTWRPEIHHGRTLNLAEGSGTFLTWSIQLRMDELDSLRVSPRGLVSHPCLLPPGRYTNPSRPALAHSLKYYHSFYRSPPPRPLSSIMAPDGIEEEQSTPSDEKKKSNPRVLVYTLDTAAKITAAEDVALTPEEAKRLRRKIDWHILPLMFSTFVSTSTVKRA